MSNKNYSDKLKDPRWQKKRLEVMQRDNFSCTKCGDKESTLNVHHESYKGEPWDQELEKLTTLCCHCHEIISWDKTHIDPNSVNYIKRFAKFKGKTGNYFAIFYRYVLVMFKYETDKLVPDSAKMIGNDLLEFLFKNMEDLNGKEIH